MKCQNCGAPHYVHAHVCEYCRQPLSGPQPGFDSATRWTVPNPEKTVTVIVGSGGGGGGASVNAAGGSGGKGFADRFVRFS